MRDTFLADAQAALLALLFGDEAQANTYLDKLTRDEYRMLIHAAQRLSKLALERHRSSTDFPVEFPYDDLSGDVRDPE
jgi:hypothetical protein